MYECPSHKTKERNQMEQGRLVVQLKARAREQLQPLKRT